jgi:hypothetical protein
VIKEEAEILMNRALDGALSGKDRDRLLRALKSDPLLRAEFEELQAAHRATRSLFEQIRLPAAFAADVMARIQNTEVPADNQVEPVRLPARRPPRKNRRRRYLAAAGRRRLTGAAGAYGRLPVAGITAALLLAAGVLVGVMIGIGATDEPDTIARTELDDLNRARDSRGGLGGERESTTQSVPMPEEREAPVTLPETGASQSQLQASEIVADDTENTEGVQQNPEGRPGRVQPDHSPRDVPAPVQPEPTVDEPQPADTPQGDKPEATDEQPNPVDDDRRTSGGNQGPAEVVGTLNLMTGRVEFLDRSGTWQRLSEGVSVNEGMRLRTNTNGVAAFSFPSGSVVMGRGSEIELLSNHAAEVHGGEVYVERMPASRSLQFALHHLEYTIGVPTGCTIVAVRRRGLMIRTPVGESTVYHETHGFRSIKSGFELELEYDRAIPEPVEGSLVLPDWSGDARVQAILNIAEPALADREMRPTERRLYDRSMPRDLKRVLRYAVDSSAVVNLLEAMFRNHNLDPRTFSQIMNEVETALAEVAEYDCDAIVNFAATAAGAVEDFNTFREQFNQLLRPAPPAQHPHQRPGRSGPDLDRERSRRNPHGPSRFPPRRD